MKQLYYLGDVLVVRLFERLKLIHHMFILEAILALLLNIALLNNFNGTRYARFQVLGKFDFTKVTFADIGQDIVMIVNAVYRF